MNRVKFVISFVFLLLVCGVLHAQKGVNKANLTSQMSIVNKKIVTDSTVRNCLDLTNRKNVSCSGRVDLTYGNLQIGSDVDWIATTFNETFRSRMVNLGLKSWKDKIQVPIIKPFPILKPGEKRVIGLNSSGKKGDDGKSGDGKSPINKTISKSSLPSSPFVKIIEGNMYAVRVVDEKNDFYALLRVDKVITPGKSIGVSWKRVKSPK